MNEHGISMEQIVFAEQHGLCNDSYGRTCLENCKLGLASAESVREVICRVEGAKAAEALGLRPPFLVPPRMDGELYWGTGDDRGPIRTPLDYLSGNVEIRGNTGSGKSTLIKRLIVQVARHIPGMIFVEMYKQDLRHLLPVLRMLGSSLVVLTPETIKLNLLQADCDVRRHLSMITDLLARSLQAPPVAVTILNAACHQLYVDFGIYDGRREAWPTVYDLYDRIYVLKNANHAAQQALLDRLARLLLGLTPAVAAWRVGWRPRDLAEQKLLIELKGAGQTAKTAIVSYLGFSLLYGRIERGASNAALSLVFGFEDAQRFLTNTSDNSDVPCIEEMAGLIRGTGAAIIASVQSGEGLRRGLVGNLSTKVLLRCGDHQDYAEAGASMGLAGQSQVLWAKLNLRPGIAIAQFSQGHWRHPFVLHISDLPPETKGLCATDNDVIESQGALASLKTVPAPEFAHWQPRHYIEITTVAGVAEHKPGHHLSETELEFLRAVLDTPGQPCGFYGKPLKMNGTRAAEIRQKLIEHGYIKEHSVATSAIGRPSLVLEPLPLAYDALGRAI